MRSMEAHVCTLHFSPQNSSGVKNSLHHCPQQGEAQWCSIWYDTTGKSTGWREKTNFKIEKHTTSRLWANCSSPPHKEPTGRLQVCQSFFSSHVISVPSTQQRKIASRSPMLQLCHQEVLGIGCHGRTAQVWSSSWGVNGNIPRLGGIWIRSSHSAVFHTLALCFV